MNKAELQSRHDALSFELSQATEECSRAFHVWKAACQHYNFLEASKRQVFVKLLEAAE